MKRIFPLACAALGVGLTAASAMAVTNPARVRHQNRRIDRGVTSGQLTPREAGQAEREQGRIAQERTDARADGRVSRGERREIRHDLKRASRHIYVQKHDSQHRRLRRHKHHPVHHPRVRRHRHVIHH